MKRIRALNKSIATRLLRVVFGLYLVIAITITVTQMVFEYQYIEDQLDNRMSSIKTSYGPSIATSLWTYNETQIQSILKGINEISSVIGMTIDDGNNTYNIGIIPDNETSSGKNNDDIMQKKTLLNGLLKYEFPIIYHDEDKLINLGKVTIYSSTSIIFEQVKYGFMLIIINSVLKTLALWVIFIYFLRKIVSRPLTQLTHAVGEINIDNLNNKKIEIDTKNDNELKVLERAFNSMIEKLSVAKNELDATNISLENKVRKRTHMLQQEVAIREQAQIKAEVATELKSMFLANMSHEIRTPMTCITGMSKILFESETDSDKKEKLALIVRNGDRLLNVINNILDYSKLEANSVTLELTEYNIRECISRNIDFLGVQARLKSIQLDYYIDDNVPGIFTGDENRLENVITNLLSNAIKFTDQGTVTLSVSLDSSGDKVLFSVKDTGIGISKTQAASIFDEFTQADSSTTRKFGGTGLGLAISKRYIELMGGKIWVDSTPDEGSTFNFTIDTLWRRANTG